MSKIKDLIKASKERKQSHFFEVEGVKFTPVFGTPDTLLRKVQERAKVLALKWAEEHITTDYGQSEADFEQYKEWLKANRINAIELCLNMVPKTRFDQAHNEKAVEIYGKLATLMAFEVDGTNMALHDEWEDLMEVVVFFSKEIKEGTDTILKNLKGEGPNPTEGSKVR